MKYFFISDIHIDFWIDNAQITHLTQEQVFDQFYEYHMCPADNLVIAGDISNDYYSYESFVNYVSTKYQQVYICFGNHDGVVNGHTFGNGNPFEDTFEKFNKIIDDFKDKSNVHFLDKDTELVDGIGGCMGMCDFDAHKTCLDIGRQYKIQQWRNWFDSRVWKMKKFNKGFHINPELVWAKYKNDMMEIVKKRPKVMVTHFCPIQLGVQREYDNSSSTAYFYFDGKDFLEEMENDSYWICGHIHCRLKQDYVNSKGNVIHICSVPSGYPGENPEWCGISKEEGLVEL